MKKKIIVKNPVAKNLAKLHKQAGPHGKSEKAERRLKNTKLQTQVSSELGDFSGDSLGDSDK